MQSSSETADGGANSNHEEVGSELGATATIGSDEGAVIGVVGTRRTDKAEAIAEVFFIIDPNYRGRGYATEALKAFITCHRLERPVIRILEAWVEEDIVSSLGVVRKCGFRETRRGKGSGQR